MYRYTFLFLISFASSFSCICGILFCFVVVTGNTALFIQDQCAKMFVAWWSPLDILPPLLIWTHIVIKFGTLNSQTTVTYSCFDNGCPTKALKRTRQWRLVLWVEWVWRWLIEVHGVYQQKKRRHKWICLWCFPLCRWNTLSVNQIP